MFGRELDTVAPITAAQTLAPRDVNGARWRSSEDASSIFINVNDINLKCDDVSMLGLQVV